MQACQQSILDLRRQIFLREIDQRFLPGQSDPQPVRPGPAQVAKPAFQLPQGLAPLRIRFGGDQIMHGLGGHKVHFAIQKGAAGEFPGLRRTQAKVGQCLRDGVDDGAPAMHV